MTYALKIAKAKFLMTSASAMQVAVEAAKNAGIPKERVFLLEGQSHGFTTIRELLEIGQRYDEQRQTKACKIPKGKKNKDTCGFLSFSSGTTGLPKAVRRRNINDVLPLQLMLMIIGDDFAPKRHRGILLVRQITPPDLTRVLAVLPAFHSMLTI